MWLLAAAAGFVVVSLVGCGSSVPTEKADGGGALYTLTAAMLADDVHFKVDPVSRDEVEPRKVKLEFPKDLMRANRDGTYRVTLAGAHFRSHGVAPGDRLFWSTSVPGSKPQGVVLAVTSESEIIVDSSPYGTTSEAFEATIGG